MQQLTNRGQQAAGAMATGEGEKEGVTQEPTHKHLSRVLTYGSMGRP